MLKDLGADVVKANNADVASLTEAFQGVYGVFEVTGELLISFRAAHLP